MNWPEHYILAGPTVESVAFPTVATQSSNSVKWKKLRLMIGNPILKNMSASSGDSHTIHLKIRKIPFKEDKILLLNIYTEKESYSFTIISSFEVDKTSDGSFLRGKLCHQIRQRSNGQPARLLPSIICTHDCLILPF